MRPALPLLALAALAACAQPGFLAADGAPPPRLLPIGTLLSATSPQLDAEAAAALTARGDDLRIRGDEAG